MSMIFHLFSENNATRKAGGFERSRFAEARTVKHEPRVAQIPRLYHSLLYAGGYASTNCFDPRAFQTDRPWPGPRTPRVESQEQLKSLQRIRGSAPTQHGRRVSKKVTQSSNGWRIYVDHAIALRAKEKTKSHNIAIGVKVTKGNREEIWIENNNADAVNRVTRICSRLGDGAVL